MRGLKHAGPVETPETLDAQARDVAEREAADRARLPEIDHEIEASVDVDHREELRDERRRVEERAHDAHELHSKLVARRDRLAIERALGELDPMRHELAKGESEIATVEAWLGERKEAVEAARVTLEDAEGQIRHPRPSSGEEAEIGWFMRQWRAGANLDDHYARLPRRLKREIRARLDAIVAGLPEQVDEYRARARASHEEAGVPLGTLKSPSRSRASPSPMRALRRLRTSRTRGCVDRDDGVRASGTGGRGRLGGATGRGRDAGRRRAFSGS